MRASEAAYARLRQSIIDWTLPPGTPLGEVETAARLGVSRTPLREALSRLVAEGLVAADHGRSLVVTPVSVEHVRSLFEVREALETQAVRLAARRWTSSAFTDLRRALVAGPATEAPTDPEQPYLHADGLDAAVDEAMGNPVLRGALRDLRGQLTRLRRHAHENPARLARANDEHLLIVEAILARDEQLAAQATAVHLHNSLQHILATVPVLAESAGEAAPQDLRAAV